MKTGGHDQRHRTRLPRRATGRPDARAEEISARFAGIVPSRSRSAWCSRRRRPGRLEQRRARVRARAVRLRAARPRDRPHRAASAPSCGGYRASLRGGAVRGARLAADTNRCCAGRGLENLAEIWALEGAGFELMDVGVTFARSCAARLRRPSPRAICTIRSSTDDDIEAIVRDDGAASRGRSRYEADPAYAPDARARAAARDGCPNSHRGRARRLLVGRARRPAGRLRDVHGSTGARASAKSSWSARCRRSADAAWRRASCEHALCVVRHAHEPGHRAHAGHQHRGRDVCTSGPASPCTRPI